MTQWGVPKFFFLLIYSRLGAEDAETQDAKE